MHECMFSVSVFTLLEMTGIVSRILHDSRIVLDFGQCFAALRASRRALRGGSVRRALASAARALLPPQRALFFFRRAAPPVALRVFALRSLIRAELRPSLQEKHDFTP